MGFVTPFFWIKPLTGASIDLKATVQFKRGSNKGSMSVLIPGHDTLQYRACLDQHDWGLLKWFGDVEAAAWEAATARCGCDRPDKISLVKGQTLTNEYWICHQEKSETVCEALIEAGTGLPLVLECGVLLGTKFRKVTASIGFEVSPRISESDRNSRLYSLFFETEDSYPTNLFKFRGGRLRQRLNNMHE
jgi:hypothetical protein